MVIKRLLLPVLAVLLFVGSIPAFAQEGPIVRRLSWQPVEYASRYELRLEVQSETGVWVEQTRRSSTETFINVPLFIGKYRFTIISFDLLGRQGSVSDWTYFEVRPQENEQAPSPEPVSPPPASVGAEKPSPDEKEKSIWRAELLFSPLLVLPGGSFNEIYSTSPVQLIGFMARVTALPFVTPYGVFGFELEPSWNYLANDILHKSRYTHTVGATAMLVWQTRPFNRHSALDLRLGGGISFIKSSFNFNEGLDTDKTQGWNPSLGVGVSFISFFTNSLFLDVGLDYYHILSQDDKLLNYLRPSIGLGWWF